MFVWVDAYLVYLKSLGVVFVVEVTQLHYPCSALLSAEHMEVEHHHLTFQLREPAYIAFVVGQCDVYHACIYHLAFVDGLLLFGFHYAYVFQSFDGYVVKVQSSLRLRIVSVPACSHGGKHLYVVLVASRVKHEHVVVTECYRLEKGEIGVRPHRFLEDIVVFHPFLVLCQYGPYGVSYHVGIKVGVANDIVYGSLQSHLTQCQFLYLGTIIGTFNFVLARHGRVGSLYRYCFYRVGSNVYYLPGYA